MEPNGEFGDVLRAVLGQKVKGIYFMFQDTGLEKGIKNSILAEHLKKPAQQAGLSIQMWIGILAMGLFFSSILFAMAIQAYKKQQKKRRMREQNTPLEILL